MGSREDAMHNIELWTYNVLVLEALMIVHSDVPVTLRQRVTSRVMVQCNGQPLIGHTTSTASPTVVDSSHHVGSFSLSPNASRFAVKDDSYRA